MARVFVKDSLKMAFVEWDEKVKALAPDGADQSFAISIRFGCADRRFQDPDAETLHLGITGRENRIAVVEDECRGASGDHQTRAPKNLSREALVAGLVGRKGQRFR